MRARARACSCAPPSPLLIAQVEAELDEVVPIDLRLGVDFDMLLITGPNTGARPSRSRRAASSR